ncbi:unnamed protein product [Pleuronectes platessa]|uniref:Uncharacterized protein n=1 Tax=Pleuronectes platessa TaxID=8262 RepID=A0A9N7UKE0_PLEPL|nr:unnamed protein product [Pleuronectes platessa]
MPSARREVEPRGVRVRGAWWTDHCVISRPERLASEASHKTCQLLSAHSNYAVKSEGSTHSDLTGGFSELQSSPVKPSWRFDGFKPFFPLHAPEQTQTSKPRGASSPPSVLEVLRLQVHRRQTPGPGDSDLSEENVVVWMKPEQTLDPGGDGFILVVVLTSTVGLHRRCVNSNSDRSSCLGAAALMSHNKNRPVLLHRASETKDLSVFCTAGAGRSVPWPGLQSLSAASKQRENPRCFLVTSSRASGDGSEDLLDDRGTRGTLTIPGVKTPNRTPLDLSAAVWTPDATDEPLKQLKTAEETCRAPSDPLLGPGSGFHRGTFLVQLDAGWPGAHLLLIQG